MIEWHQIVGIIGAILIVFTYYLLQIGKISSSGILFSFLNALGAILLIISLSFTFNLGALLIEVFWAACSIYGIIKYLRSKKKSL